VAAARGSCRSEAPFAFCDCKGRCFFRVTQTFLCFFH
jgi:hypothetical protein